MAFVLKEMSLKYLPRSPNDSLTSHSIKVDNSVIRKVRRKNFTLLIHSYSISFHVTELNAVAHTGRTIWDSGQIKQW